MSPHGAEMGEPLGQFLIRLLVIAALAGCTETRTHFPVESSRNDTAQAAQGAAASGANRVRVTLLDPANVPKGGVPGRGHRATDLPASGEWRYRVGTGDVLDITVWDHPELTMPAGPQRDPAESGARVQSDGTFFYPYVGQVPARGLTPEEIRADLTTRLATYIPDPQLEVRVAAYNSQGITVGGEVREPRRIPATHIPMTLLDALGAAGGLTETADTRRVSVQRGGRKHTVDLEGFLAQGIQRNNPLLQPGDVVSVSLLRPQEAYLLGELRQPRTIDLAREDVNLTQALARSGGLDERRADARGVFVFRQSGGTTDVYQLNLRDPVAFLTGNRFLLRPEDVVYVTSAPLTKWNDTINMLLPTVTGAVGVRGSGN